MDNFLIYIFIVNCIGFLIFGIDKYKAKHHKYRIPEKALFMVAWIGGVAGCMIGMHVFRHKTLHKSFKYGMPCILVLWIAFLIYLEQYI